MGVKVFMVFGVFRVFRVFKMVRVFACGVLGLQGSIWVWPDKNDPTCNMVFDSDTLLKMLKTVEKLKP